MYVARDKDGCLYSYEEKPWRQEVDKMWIDFPIYLDYKLDGIGCITQLDSDLYPELIWEDEPLEVNLVAVPPQNVNLDYEDRKFIMDASLEKDKNGVLYLLYRKNENSRPVKVELSSLLDIKPSSETLGNHLRNLLSPYQQMIDVLDHICDENETDDIKIRLLTLLYKQLESKKSNLRELIEFSKSSGMESNYWRI